MTNHNEFLFAITTTIIFLVLVCVSIVVFVIQSRKKIFNKEIEKKDLQIQFQNEILERAILVQEEERKRIAQDLHDDISSKLIAISLNLHLLKSDKTKEEDKIEIINSISEINKKTIDTSRKIAHNLFPPVLEKFGLKAALDELINDYNKTKEVHITIYTEVLFKDFGTNLQLQIFRIIQELINNSIKHGKASKIELNFKTNNTINTCIYSDNGVGFNCKELNKTKGLGFSNVENRIQNIKGDYSINSEIGKGFQIKFTFKDE
ncbi:sensor histidine kinase [Flavobacterium sp.]|jgi:signal transduction histidine kinase|uniref:sensor histidine kinase n=1 Tax=Flavobacterium sp. TaxID=239 RepID=UPI002A805703|nr:histidine kinase [Flavobacterium sp.]